MSDQSSKRKTLRDEPVFETPVGAFAAVRSGDVSMGEVLREHREAAGATLDEVADALRIRKIFLEALEDNRIGDLPGQAYAIGFVRSYAEALGFDGEAAVEAYKHELAGVGNKANLVFPEPMPESRIPKGGILFVSVILAAGAYGVWYYMNEHNLRFADLIPEVPTELAEQGPASVASPQPAPTAPASATTPAPAMAAPAKAAEEVSTADARPAAPAPAAEPSSSPPTEDAAAAPPTAIETPRPVPPRVAEMRQRAEAAAPAPAPETDTASSRRAPAPSTSATETPPAAPEATVSAPPAPDTGVAASASASELPSMPPAVPVAELAPQSPPRSPPAAAERAPEPAIAADAPRGRDAQVADVMERIEVRAKADSWIQVRSEGGALLMTRILRAGDTYVVPRERGLSLMTGNAGALEILVDGEAVPAIGPFGAVRRGVALDAGRLRAGTASRP